MKSFKAPRFKLPSILYLLFITTSLAGYAQKGSINSKSSAKDKPSIFLDCKMGCDLSYVKNEIQFVDYMRNRQDADVYVLIVRQRTGGGGGKVQLLFSGNESYNSLTDTLTYYTGPNATSAENRELLVLNLKKGVLPYLLLSPLVNDISYNISQPDTQQKENELTDPWDYWVFNVGGNVSVNGESSYTSSDIDTRLSANRTTEKSKFNVRGKYSIEKSTYKLTDGEIISNVLREYYSNCNYVHSISNHWSVGAKGYMESSTFENTDFAAGGGPGVEFNVFPYSEASTKRFSFLYAAGLHYKDYTETTIYDKTVETNPQHTLNISFRQTQQWGNAHVYLSAEQYLHDLNLYNLSLNPYMNLNIVKGLSFNIGGAVSFVNDRINIAKSTISDQDILLQTKQLDTKYSYRGNVGMNYRFGSKYNNIVNQRF